MVDKLTLSAIHARFRQLRNGEIVDNLAAQGISYRLAWGLESYRLREIAQEFEKSAELAETLWNEDVRESKMLATRLYPIDEMTIEKAISWVEESKYTEIADQICMNLLSRMPMAETIAEELAKKDIDEKPIAIYSAIKLATRIESKTDKMLVLSEKILNENVQFYLKTAALWYKQMYEQS